MSKKTEPTRGGKREGAGRKAIKDPKIPVTFYIRNSIVKSYGNIDKFRDNFKELFTLKQKNT